MPAFLEDDAAIYPARDRRAFWAGFALFGFAYLWMVAHAVGGLESAGSGTDGCTRIGTST
jgi:hypothetical protein